MTETKKDLGMAVLEYLNNNTDHPGGDYINIKLFVLDFIQKHGMSKTSAKNVIYELTKSKYVGSPNQTEIISFDNTAPEIIEAWKKIDLMYNLTWKGKAFYLDHVQKGVLDSREKIGFWAILILTAIATVIAAWQLCITIADREMPSTIMSSPQEKNQSTTQDSSQQNIAPFARLDSAKTNTTLKAQQEKNDGG